MSKQSSHLHPNTSHDSFLGYALGECYAQVSHLPKLKRLFALPAYHWVLLASMLTTLTHSMHAPWWLWLLLLFSACMQLPSVRHHIHVLTGKRLIASYHLLQLSSFVLGIMGLGLTFGFRLGAEIAIGFLLLCLGAKLWELHKRRDAYVLLNLSLFVLAAAFLWSQDVLMAVAVVVALMAVLMGFIALNDENNTTGAGRLRSLTLVALPAVPLLVLLFLFFPRMPPLWSFHATGQNARTGVSDSMSPGDFSNLSRSTELAFRVTFDGALPNRSDMYWRGMVFSHFDGNTWRQSDFSQHYWSSQEAAPAWLNNAYQGRPKNHYQVILEPTHQHWLFALDYPRPTAARDIGMNPDFNLRTPVPVSQQRHYQVAHYPHAKIDTTLSQLAWRINTNLPKGSNPKSLALAQDLYAQAGGNTQKMIDLIANHIRSQPFRYTLSPPLLAEARIDDFLFNTQAGFCEHYASSFVFLMRAAGIPARVVAGYQGGELGRDGESWEVRQMDAHAWAEVWIADDGWLRVDPTAFVAPERIEDGMHTLTDNAGVDIFGGGMMAQLGYQQFRLSQRLRRYADQISYYWQKDVVGFDQDSQKNALLQWLNITNLTSQLLLLAGLFITMFTAFGAFIWIRRRRTYHPYDQAVLALSARLQRKDITLARGFDEPVLGYLTRLNAHANIADDTAQALIQHYRQARYSKGHDHIDKRSLRAFKRQLSILGKSLR